MTLLEFFLMSIKLEFIIFAIALAIVAIVTIAIMGKEFLKRRHK